jgi:hypothetical protein
VILLSSRNLELAFVRDELTKWDKVKYIILMAVLSALLSGPFYWIRPLYGTKMPALNMLVSFACSVLSAYIAYWGIKKCFQINEGGDGRSFFQRFACLTVPVMFQVMLLAIPALIGLAMGLGFVVTVIQMIDPEFQRQRITPYALYLLGPALAFLYYHLLKRSFLRLGELMTRTEIDTEEISPT